MPVRTRPYPTRDSLPQGFVDWFWASVRKSDGCWEWLRGRDGRNYGACHFKGRLFIASRMAYVLAHGSVPTDMQVRHRCDNPPCCRPDHLILGTFRDNMADRTERGRMVHHRGAANCNAKLSPGEVREARDMHADGWNSVQLGLLFGISQSSMSRLLRGVTYQEVS